MKENGFKADLSRKRTQHVHRIDKSSLLGFFKGSPFVKNWQLPHLREEVFCQIPTPGTEKMTNARSASGGGGDGHT